MKQALMATCATMLILGLSATASAQDPDAGEALNGGSNAGVEYQKETNYDFEGDDVEGALVKPDGENFNGNQHGKTSSLIKIRADFVPELLKSVEDI